MKKVLCFLCIATFIVAISLSCERPESTLLNEATEVTVAGAPYQGSVSIEEAQNFFTNTVLKTGATARQAGDKQYKRAVDWSTARKVKQDNGLEVIVAQIRYETDGRPGIIIWDDNTPEEQKKPKIENVLKINETLITFKDKSGQLQTQLMQYIPSKDYRGKKKEGIDKEDFSGWVIARTWDEQLLTGFEYKNGRDVKQLISTSKAANGRVAECNLIYSTGVTTYCRACSGGGACTECDIYIWGSYSGTCTMPSSNSGTDGNGVNYSGNGGGGYYVPTPADYNSGISCTSFVFTKTSSLWQEAGVKGFYINIVYWTEQRREVRRYDIPGQVVIGMPLKRSNGQAISSGQAATIAAYIVANASDQTFVEYRDRQGQPSDWEVERSFRNNLNSAAAAMGIGANASTNGSGSPLILIKQSEFTFLGNGNCSN